MKNQFAGIGFVIFVVFGQSWAVQAEDGLMVHEWGTTTSIQDASGRTVNGINIASTVEHILPDFVHSLSNSLKKLNFNELQKGGPIGHPDVTMRLETPVVYFYPGSDFDISKPVDFSVDFYGGLLNEYYPDAESNLEGFGEEASGAKLHMTEKSRSSLSWQHLQLGSQGKLPQTDNPVWTSPRVDEAATVTNSKGESEKYLFYRGVANLPALFKTTLDTTTGALTIRSNPKDERLENAKLTVPQVWLIDIQSAGAVYKTFGTVALKSGTDNALLETNLKFDSVHSEQNLGKLKSEVHAALVAGGLYPAEASAMLKTWDSSYFKQTGTRLMYILPRDWVDAHLPIKLSVPAHLKRVFIGRIELATWPFQIGQAASYESIDAAFKNYQTVLETHKSLKHPDAVAAAEKLDKLCQQKDCYASKLAWHTSRESAQRQALKESKPILSLRLLGNLTDEYSCANSRFFRSVLYPDPIISEYLRKNYVLLWESERPVPIVTVDYGDGRKLKSTITGNSIHYILDSSGRPIDAIPGLYSPKEFVRIIQSAKMLFDLRLTPEALETYYQKQLRLLETKYPYSEYPSTENRYDAYSAEMLSISKSRVERPTFRGLSLKEKKQFSESVVSDPRWLQLGINYEREFEFSNETKTFMRSKESYLSDKEFNPIMQQFKSTVAIDTVRNEATLHREIYRKLLKEAQINFETLNKWVYDDLFLTPKRDPWLGLFPEGVYTGLQNDGVIP